MNFSDFRFYVPPLSVWVRGQHLPSSWIYWSEVDNQKLVFTNKVDQAKIVGGFKKNSPQLTGNPIRQRFLDLFKAGMPGGELMARK